MRKVPFIKDELYHVYNRGVDKRSIYENPEDLERFFQSVNEFNNTETIGSIYEQSYKKKTLGTPTSKLVTFVAFNIIKNHFHFILKENVDGGISKFMQRFQGGYTKFFNGVHRRSGSLFQGKFKSIHINTNEYLLHLSAYVNLNDKLHQLGSRSSQLEEMCSSFVQYVDGKIAKIECNTDIILEQFSSREKYEKFALNTLEDIKKRKVLQKELKEDDIDQIKS